jgi:hypothetical protein
MKLPLRRRKPAPEAAEPPRASPANPVLQVLIFSNTSLPEQEFSAQTEKISRVGSYDRDTRSWYTWIPLDRAERAAEMLTTLFETARLHGASIQVLAQPADGAANPGRRHDSTAAACPSALDGAEDLLRTRPTPATRRPSGNWPTCAGSRQCLKTPLERGGLV